MRCFKVYGIGIKELGAILTAGHAADGAFWYDDRTGTWMSSTYYGDKLRLMDLNAMLMPGQYLNQSWNTLIDPLLHPGCQTDLNNTWSWASINRTGFHMTLSSFHHRQADKCVERLFRSAPDPFADDFTTELALRLIDNEQLGRMISLITLQLHTLQRIISGIVSDLPPSKLLTRWHDLTGTSA
jgi:hypothetical protein